MKISEPKFDKIIDMLLISKIAVARTKILFSFILMKID